MALFTHKATAECGVCESSLTYEYKPRDLFARNKAMEKVAAFTNTHAKTCSSRLTEIESRR